MPSRNNENQFAGTYRRGAIIRIQMHNFLTYTDAEVRPGAKLNIVVGPNGTGKSSVVCAICLCLGGSHKSLDRAEKYKDFVKKGANSGYVEVDLHEAGRNDSTLTIRMDISVDSNNAHWKVNGMQSSRKKVNDLMRDLAIQVDNLCCFLAQDRVVKFASLDSIKLLQETEKAVNPQLHSWHMKLIEQKKAEKKLTTQTEELEKSLTSFTQQKECLEQDVKRMRDRDQIKEKIDTLQKKALWLKYGNLREASKAIKVRYKAAANDLQKIEEELAPLKKAKEAAQAHFDKLKREELNLAKSEKAVNAEKRKVLDNIEAQQNRIDNAWGEVDEIEREVSQLEEKREKLQQEIRTTEDYLKELPEEKEINANLKNILEEQRELNRKRRKFNNEKEDINREMYNLRAKITSATQRMQQERSNKQTSLARGGKKHVEIKQWIERNRHKFKGEILGPLYNEIKVSNPLHAKYVENAVGKARLQYYLVDNKEDWSTLPQQIRSNTGQKVTVASVTRIDDRTARHIDLKGLQDESGVSMQWLDQVIDADRLVMQGLKDIARVHKIAVTQEEVARDKVEKVMQKKRGGPGVPHLFNGNDRLRVTFSSYSDDVSSSETLLKKAELLQEEEDDQIAQYQLEIKECRSKLRKLESKKHEVEQQNEKLNKPIKEGAIQTRDLRASMKKIKAVKNKLTILRRQLAQLEHDGDGEMKKRRIYKDLQRMNTICLEKAAKLGQCVDLYMKYSFQRDCLLPSIEDARINLNNAEQKLNEHDAELNEKKRILRATKEEYDAAKRKSDDAKRMARSRAPFNEYKEKFQEEWINQKDLDQVETMITELEVQLDGLVEDRTLFARYEELTKKIEELTKNTNSQKERLEEARNDIKEIREKWQPKVRLLARRLSEEYAKHFREMKCEGEIKVYPEPNDEKVDYDQYGLEIWVRFRDGSDLQKLSKFRQSGGERSVSTMLYLLCLQSVTQTPFRVVDEINQGMDTKNERMIFDRIVRSCALKNSGEESPQYFLVTPKLLPNLVYPEGSDISVLTVYNGYGMLPAEEWDMESMVQNVLKASRKRKKID